MASQSFLTWNPVLRFDLLNNPALTEEFTNRTLSFTLTDNALQYDQFEWVLDNRDGMITRPEVAALGLLFRVRLGYQSDTTPWRAFFVNRMNGGVGCWGPAGVALGDPESQITLSGRNRNAPDLKATRGKKGKKGFKGRPTSDIVRLESLHRPDPLYEDDQATTRRFTVSRLSDAIREIARGMGFADSKIYVEDTDDTINGVVIPQGVETGLFLTQKANELGWRYRATNDTFRFHSPQWSGRSDRTYDRLVYGEGKDILSLNVDVDFKVRAPTRVSAKSYNPIRRTSTAVDVTAGDSSIGNVAISTIGVTNLPSEGKGKSNRLTVLTTEDVFMAGGGTLNLASRKAQRHFITRNMNTVTISVTSVGNPYLMADRTVSLEGTGSPLVDRKWYIEQAQHVFDGSTYTTVLKLSAPKKRKGDQGLTTATSVAQTKDALGKVGISTFKVKNIPRNSSVFTEGRKLR